MAVKGWIGKSEANKYFKERAPWELKRSFIFRKCYETGKIIWPFTKAYYASEFVLPRLAVGIPEFKNRWISQQAYIFLKLKGEL